MSADHTEPVPSRADEATTDAQIGDQRRRTKLALLAVVSVAVAIGLVVLILNLAGDPAGPGDAPSDNWDSPDIAPAQELKLKEGDLKATVIVGAGEETCWMGYISSEEVEGCGNAVFEVTGAATTLGANIRQDDSDRAFLGLSIWSADGNRIDRGDTDKPFGVVGLTASLPEA